MACSHVSMSSLSLASRVNSTLSAPSGIQNGDILRIYQVIDANTAVTPPTGFAQTINVNGTTEHALDLWVWWKRASGESGDYTVTHSSGFTEAYMECVRGGVASGSPDDPAASSNEGNENATITALGVTTAADGSLVTFASGTWDDMPEATPPAGTTPTFTERYDAGANNSLLYVANGVLDTAGATGNKTVTGPATNDWLATLVVTKADPPPAAAGVTPDYSQFPKFKLRTPAR